jgi:hypothetical protein
MGTPDAAHGAREAVFRKRQSCAARGATRLTLTNHIYPVAVRDRHEHAAAPARGDQLVRLHICGWPTSPIAYRPATPRARDSSFAASASAHHWARKLQALGHTVRLMAPQFVKPYVKSNKNDAADGGFPGIGRSGPLHRQQHGGKHEPCGGDAGQHPARAAGTWRAAAPFAAGALPQVGDALEGRGILGRCRELGTQRGFH